MEKIDYMTDTDLPSSNVIKYVLDNGSVLLIRPSGTEAKIKFYSYETGNFTPVEREIIRLIEYYKSEAENRHE